VIVSYLHNLFVYFLLLGDLEGGSLLLTIILIFTGVVNAMPPLVKSIISCITSFFVAAEIYVKIQSLSN